MTEQTQFDRVLPGLFDELAAARTPEYLEAAIGRASSRRQRPAWTYLGTWIPMSAVTGRVATVPRFALRAALVAALLIIALAAAALFVGSQQRRLPPPFGPAANGAIALAKDGDILVADRPGGDLRPLVTGPENDQNPMFSPDGTRLAFSRETELGSRMIVADADGANAVQLPLGFLADRFAPDSRSLMGVNDVDHGNRVVVLSVDPVAAPIVLDIMLGGSMVLSQSGGPSFNPMNASEILVLGDRDAGGPRGIFVYDLATGGVRTVREQARDEYLFNVAWLPDGEHITYVGSNGARVIAADGSGDQAFDAVGDEISPLSNDGARVVVDVAEVDLPGDDSHQKSVVVPTDGKGEPVELACGLGTDIECAWSWLWSPDDSLLIGTVPHETSSTYLLADAETGQVTKLDWVGADFGRSAWQRVAP